MQYLGVEISLESGFVAVSFFGCRDSPLVNLAEPLNTSEIDTPRARVSVEVSNLNMEISFGGGSWANRRYRRATDLSRLEFR